MPLNVSTRPWRTLLWGLAAAAAVVGFYLGLNTLTADWFFAKAQFNDYRWWLIALAAGLGLQVTLYTSFRSQMQGAGRKSAAASMTTSGGVSAASMAACCAHYMVAFLPAFSVPFFSAAAASLERYQKFFFLAGIVSCALGLVLMIRLFRKNGISPMAAVGIRRRFQIQPNSQ